MQITIEAIPESSIAEFAKQHDLKFKVVERKEPKDSPMRYYAHFDDVDVKEYHFLIGEYGNGTTPKQAINDYARKIEFKILVFNAYGKDRREIKVPRLF